MNETNFIAGDVNFGELCNIKVPIPDHIKQLMQILIDNNYEAYLIGGCIRDILMGIEPNDYDIFTNANGEQLLKIFPNGHVIGGKERQEKILTVIVDGVEISQYRKSGDRTEVGETLKEHQATCDFTINAIACDINGDINRDNCFNKDGIADICEKTLRFVGSPKLRIAEDPLRVLRGLRFLLKYNLTPSKTTSEYIIQYTDGHKQLDVPKERIRDELMKILSLDMNEMFINDIAIFLPEQLRYKNMLLDGGSMHNETPLEHSVYAFLEICKLTKKPLLRLAPLLHDIGKSETREEKNGKVVFYNHHYKGSDIVTKWMIDMKFSNNDINYMSCLIKNHMHGMMNKEPNRKSYAKLFYTLRCCGVPLIDYITLCYCDNQGNLRNPRIKFVDYLRENKYLNTHELFIEKNVPLTHTEVVVKGGDLIKRYNLKGKEIGNWLRYIFNRIMDENIENNEKSIYNRLDYVIKLTNESIKKENDLMNIVVYDENPKGYLDSEKYLEEFNKQLVDALKSTTYKKGKLAKKLTDKINKNVK